MKVTIDVTQDDIDSAWQEALELRYALARGERCPIARAAERRLGRKVWVETRIIKPEPFSDVVIAHLPEIAQQAITTFDDDVHISIANANSMQSTYLRVYPRVAPFRFDIEVSE
jgi:hypothetical protein